MEDQDDLPLFYINIFNKGQIMKHDDIYAFLSQLNLPAKDDYILPCSNIEIIKRVIRNLMTAYEALGSIDKKEEISILLRLLEDNK